MKSAKVKVTAGGEKHVVYKKTTKKGEGKVGNIMVNHPTKDKGQWDTIDLTAKGRAKTIKQGVAATKKWHKDNPDYDYKGKGMAKSGAQQAAIAISMKKAGKKPKMKSGGSTPAWTRKEGKNPEGGLNAKGVASYRAANPGSKLKTAVTTKPSKIKPGSEAAGRRKSFCSRMSGMKKKLTSAKTANDPNSRINKSLRKWNC
jgi:hypothetical protein